jgi:hypothetical protein
MEVQALLWLWYEYLREDPTTCLTIRNVATIRLYVLRLVFRTSSKLFLKHNKKKWIANTV